MFGEDTSFEEENTVLYDVTAAAASIVQDLLPTKSRERYEKAYEMFKDWCKEKQIKGLSEDVLVAYFGEKAKIYKSSSLWSTFSMLKSTLMIKENLNIGQFSKLVAFLKKKNVGCHPKRSRIFSKSDVDKFLQDAPDKEFLMMKVVLIMGLAGGCRCDELVKLSLDDIDDQDNILIVKIPDTKTHKPRSFVVIEGNNGINISLYKKYVALRPSHTPHRRLFVFYKSDKCTVQPVGLHTFAKISTKIASYLQLPQPELYTGHCLLRTSATLLVNGGGDITTFKRHGGWRSANVAEGYIEESLENKISIANRIQHQEITRRNNANTAGTTILLSETPVLENVSINSNNCDDTASANHIVVSNTSSKNVPPSINICNIKNTSVSINISY